MIAFWAADFHYSPAPRDPDLLFTFRAAKMFIGFLFFPPTFEIAPEIPKLPGEGKELLIFFLPRRKIFGKYPEKREAVKRYRDKINRPGSRDDVGNIEDETGNGERQRKGIGAVSAYHKFP